MQPLDSCGFDCGDLMMLQNESQPLDSWILRQTSLFVVGGSYKNYLESDSKNMWIRFYSMDGRGSMYWANL